MSNRALDALPLRIEPLACLTGELRSIGRDRLVPVARMQRQAAAPSSCASRARARQGWQSAGLKLARM